ncbi:MAG: DUF5320 domain-containing protein [Candidatus Xenobiia bacterium LiM19]
MPGFDGTGPMGYGPRTGRGMGYCPPNLPGYNAYGNPVYGQGRGGAPWGCGRGWGGGGGWGGGYGRGRGFGRGRFWGSPDNYPQPQGYYPPPY